MTKELWHRISALPPHLLDELTAALFLRPALSGCPDIYKKVLNKILEPREKLSGRRFAALCLAASQDELNLEAHSDIQQLLWEEGFKRGLPGIWRRAVKHLADEITSGPVPLPQTSENNAVEIFSKWAWEVERFQNDEIISEAQKWSALRAAAIIITNKWTLNENFEFARKLLSRRRHLNPAMAGISRERLPRFLQHLLFDQFSALELEDQAKFLMIMIDDHAGDENDFLLDWLGTEFFQGHKKVRQQLIRPLAAIIDRPQRFHHSALQRIIKSCIHKPESLWNVDASIDPSKLLLRAISNFTIYQEGKIPLATWKFLNEKLDIESIFDQWIELAQRSARSGRLADHHYLEIIRALPIDEKNRTTAYLALVKKWCEDDKKAADEKDFLDLASLAKNFSRKNRNIILTAMQNRFPIAKYIRINLKLRRALGL